MAELKQSMGFVAIYALTVVSLMGSSMYFGVSMAAAVSGTASLIAWAIVAMMALYISACFGELISMFPNAGGVYEYAKHTYGRFGSFFIGWMSWMVGNVTTSLMIVAAIDYAMPGSENNLLKIIIIIGIILVLNFITLLGVEASDKVMIFFVVITLGMIIAILSPGLFRVEAINYSGIFSVSAPLLLLTVFFIVESFFGCESASYMAEEVKNAARVLPKAIMWATATSITLGFLLAFVQIGMLSQETILSTNSTFLEIAGTLYGSLGGRIVNIAIIITLFGAAAGGIVATPRLLLALGRDKLFIEQFSHVHKKFRTPDKAIYLQTVLAIVFVLIAYGNYEDVLNYLVPMALLMYVSVLIAVPVLRKKRKDIKRTFKAPLGRILPIIVSLIYIAIIFIWAKEETQGLQTLKVLGSFMLLAVPIYLLLTFHYNPSHIIRFLDTSARINYWLEGILLPKSIRQRLVKLFPNLKDSKVLEFGSGVGSLTMDLAREVGPGGEVLAVDMSRRNLLILEKRYKKKKIIHIKTLHDEHLINRIHPDIKRIDAVFSIGHLSYIQDIGKVLKEIYDLLPETGKICFVEYVFYLIPNKAILGDKHALRKVFRTAGFSVNIIEYKSIFWKFLVVYGIKSGEDEVPVV